jgi:hypothetical protein
VVFQEVPTHPCNININVHNTMQHAADPQLTACCPLISCWYGNRQGGGWSAGCYQFKSSSSSQKQVYFNKHAIGATNPSAELLCGKELDKQTAQGDNILLAYDMTTEVPRRCLF